MKDREVLIPMLDRGASSSIRSRRLQGIMSVIRERDSAWLFLGWTVIHFWEKEILKIVNECVRVIEETIFDMEIEDDGF